MKRVNSLMNSMTCFVSSSSVLAAASHSASSNDFPLSESGNVHFGVGGQLSNLKVVYCQLQMLLTPVGVLYKVEERSRCGKFRPICKMARQTCVQFGKSACSISYPCLIDQPLTATGDLACPASSRRGFSRFPYNSFLMNLSYII